MVLRHLYCVCHLHCVCELYCVLHLCCVCHLYFVPHLYFSSPAWCPILASPVLFVHCRVFYLPHLYFKRLGIAGPRPVPLLGNIGLFWKSGVSAGVHPFLCHCSLYGIWIHLAIHELSNGWNSLCSYNEEQRLML